MKLLSKIIKITDLQGKQIDMEGKPILLELNGERIDMQLASIVSHMEFDEGEIYGNCLLSHYNINEDGSLQVEGSHVRLIDGTTNAPILVKQFKKPTIHDNGDIPFEHVKKFVDFFKIAKPEDVFPGLSEEEKQVFISSRVEQVPSHVDAEPEPEPEPEPGPTEEEKQAEKKANDELKASINPSYVMHKKEYLATQGFYANLYGFKEYIHEKYHLFYGNDPAHEPCVLIKHGDWWEEVTEENTEVLDKTDKTVLISFMERGVTKKITLDINSGQITISDLDAQ